MAESNERRTKEMHEMQQSGATLQQVGDHFGVTRERVRQVLSAAGYATRRPPRVPIVRDPGPRPECRVCGADVPVGRRSYCSDPCSRKFTLRTMYRLTRAQTEAERATCGGCGGRVDRLGCIYYRRKVAQVLAGEPGYMSWARCSTCIREFNEAERLTHEATEVFGEPQPEWMYPKREGPRRGRALGRRPRRPRGRARPRSAGAVARCRAQRLVVGCFGRRAASGIRGGAARAAPHLLRPQARGGAMSATTKPKPRTSILRRSPDYPGQRVTLDARLARIGARHGEPVERAER